MTDVEHLGARVLRVTFSDGLVRELDIAHALLGILSSVDSDEVFAQVSIDPVARTVCWPIGVDLDPDVLHGDAQVANGVAPQLIRSCQLEQAR